MEKRRYACTPEGSLTVTRELASFLQADSAIRVERSALRVKLNICGFPYLRYRQRVNGMPRAGRHARVWGLRAAMASTRGSTAAILT
jgi:hypothetical protein